MPQSQVDQCEEVTEELGSQETQPLEDVLSRPLVRAHVEATNAFLESRGCLELARVNVNTCAEGILALVVSDSRQDAASLLLVKSSTRQEEEKS